MSENAGVQHDEQYVDINSIKSSKSLKEIMEEVVLNCGGGQVKEGFIQTDDESNDIKRKTRSQQRTVRRTRFEVLHDLLEYIDKQNIDEKTVTAPEIKNHLKITAAVTQSYVDFSVINGLIDDKWGVLNITEKGKNTKQKLEELFELIDMKTFNC